MTSMAMTWCKSQWTIKPLLWARVSHQWTWETMDEVWPKSKEIRLICNEIWIQACLGPIKISHVLGFNSQNSNPSNQPKASNQEVINISNTPMSWTTTRVFNPPQSKPYSLPTSRSMIRVSTQTQSSISKISYHGPIIRVQKSSQISTESNTDPVEAQPRIRV